MRKLWAAVLAPVLALAFFVVGSPAANAFGSEVLGCHVNDGTWTANSCVGGGLNTGDLNSIFFDPHNLSGTYAMQWTVNNPDGGTITMTCGTSIIGPCIARGCTSTSTTCFIRARNRAVDKTFTATLRLTQSGQSRTIQASATILRDPNA